MKLRRILLLLALGAALAPLPAMPQAYPTRPVHLIVPNPPGGAIDLMAQLLAQHLRPQWTQPVVVEFKPGAGTALGTDFTAKSAPDGHTICIVVTAHVINPSVRPLAFDPVKDLSGISMIAVSDILISATPNLPAKNMAEVLALAKAQPGKLTYASPGSGSSMHMAGELIKQRAGIDVLHVPFKGSGPAFPEVFAGRIDLMIDPLFSSLPHVKAGRMKAIAVTSAKRSPAAPDIPTVAETVPGIDVMSIYGLVVPAATPRDIVRRLNADVLKALQAPDLRKRFAESGLEPVGTSPEEFDAYVRTEIDKWAKVVKAANIKLD